MRPSPYASSPATRIQRLRFNEGDTVCHFTPDSDECTNNGSRKCKDCYSDYLNTLAESMSAHPIGWMNSE